MVEQFVAKANAGHRHPWEPAGRDRTDRLDDELAFVVESGAGQAVFVVVAGTDGHISRLRPATKKQPAPDPSPVLKRVSRTRPRTPPRKPRGDEPQVGSGARIR